MVIRLVMSQWSHDYVEMIDKLHLDWDKMFILSFIVRKKTIDSDDYNLARDSFELALLHESLAPE